MDLKSLSTTTEATYDLELIHPVHGPTGLFITHKSATDPELEAYARKQANRMIAEDYAAQRKGKKDVPTVESSVKRSADYLARATVGWFERDAKGKRVEGWAFDGKRVEFSHDEAVRIYSDPGFKWIRDALDESVGDLGNFITS